MRNCGNWKCWGSEGFREEEEWKNTWRRRWHGNKKGGLREREKERVWGRCWMAQRVEIVVRENIWGSSIFLFISLFLRWMCHVWIVMGGKNGFRVCVFGGVVLQPYRGRVKFWRVGFFCACFQRHFPIRGCCARQALHTCDAVFIFFYVLKVMLLIHYLIN